MKDKSTKQMQAWSGDFGQTYTERNAMSLAEMEAMYRKNFGKARTGLNKEFLDALDHSISVLEVGSNVGNQLLCLQGMGFHNLYGIELQQGAVEEAKSRTTGINIIQGSAFDVPFKDGFFDLVFTSGVLIHINPQDIERAIKEVYRCSSRYIWGFEYYADTYTEIPYRGHSDLLWKTDFAKLFLDTFSGLELVKEKRVTYADSTNQDSMYLLEKR